MKNMNTDKQRIAIGARVLSAITAFLCCILPLVAVMLGLSGFAAASVFAKWRPLFLAVTFALLGAAWYLTYRKSKAACPEGAVCAANPAAKWNKFVLWVATAAVVAVAAFPLYGGALARLAQCAPTPGSSSQAATLPAVASAANLATLKVRIPSLECSLCANGVQATVQKLDGVHDVQVSYESKQGIVHYDPVKISQAKLLDAINQTGYKATLES